MDTATLQERRCLACLQPCRNTRHPDTQDYDLTLPPCHCCVEHRQIFDSECWLLMTKAILGLRATPRPW